ncbi:MAG: hypothetical protein KatS3mg087_1060 [Patescibacteria group bacterium]|nr:MAG: hypothetical protein KatS3mg087_1060 [Patescibacteria group bacterium]
MAASKTERHAKLVKALAKARLHKHSSWVTGGVKKIILQEYAWSIGACIKKLSETFGLPQDQIEDLNSEAYLSAFKALDFYDASKGASLSTFIYCVLWNNLRSHLNNERKYVSAVKLCASRKSLEALNEQKAFEQLLLRERYAEINEAFKIVKDLLDKLNDRHKIVVVRYFGLDCEAETFQQIASDLGVSRSRVHQLLHEALELIRILYARHRKKQRLS